MSTAIQQRAPAQPVAPALTTPQILKTGLVCIWIATLLLMTAAITGAQSHRRAMKAVGKDSAPSIIAAQHIHAALADMDANAALESRQTFLNRREEAVSAIIAAAETSPTKTPSASPFATSPWA